VHIDRPTLQSARRPHREDTVWNDAACDESVWIQEPPPYWHSKKWRIPMIGMRLDSMIPKSAPAITAGSRFRSV
jgi:hypothetical protein